MHDILRKIGLAISICFLTFFIASRLFFFHSGRLEQCAAYILYPVTVMASKLADMGQRICKQKEKYEKVCMRYHALQEAYDKLERELIIMRSAYHYDQQSNDLRTFCRRYNLDRKPCIKILCRTLTEHEHSFIIDQGSRHGVQKNMIALYKLQILGRVSEVYDFYSKVILITDKHCNVAGYTSKTGAPGIIQGNNQLASCNFAYVNHLYPVNPDDLIISSGQGLLFPEGFCLGKITHHNLKEKDLYHTMTIQPLVDFATIQFCILTDHAVSDAYEGSPLSSSNYPTVLLNNVALPASTVLTSTCLPQINSQSYALAQVDHALTQTLPAWTEHDTLLEEYNQDSD